MRTLCPKGLRWLGGGLLIVGVSGTLAGRPRAATNSGPTRIDPKIGRAIAIGFVSPFDAHARGLHPGKANVVVELFAPATAKSLAALEKAGAKLTYLAGVPLSHDRFVPATLDTPALTAIGTLAAVKRVSLAPAMGPLALDRSAQLIGLDGVRGVNRPSDELTGKGMVIADADTDIDVFHPKFFRADAGWFDWIDVDGNGVFSPGIDAVDLDGDGKVGNGETAHLLRSQTLDAYYRPTAARAVGFDPAIDWIFLDTNGNGMRDVGPANGFEDSTPAFGEPLFVPDDVNGDGQLGRQERLARLGTSKIAAVYVDLEPPYVPKTSVQHVFHRGTDLSQLLPTYTDFVYGYADAVHATAVVSILAGDVPLVGRRWVGMAPDADVLVAWTVESTLAHVTWALEQKPDVMQHGTAPWTGQPLDGSDAYSMMIDASVTANHVTHTCPTGDIGNTDKHAHVIVPAGGTRSLYFNAPRLQSPYRYVQLSLNVRNVPASNSTPPPTIAVELVDPNGDRHDIATGPGVLAGGANFYPSTSTTDRGTYFVDIVVYTPDNSSATIPNGDWSIDVTGDAALGATIDAYVSDDLSGLARGIAWKAPLAVRASTIAYPATADHCIAIGAEPAHAASEGSWFLGDESVDTVRDYSPRGPRIDGMTKPDVLAPDNPWSAAPNVLALRGDTTPSPPGAVVPFGGTSGSVPHATGVAALMAQLGIRGDDVAAALRSSARTDGIIEPLPNADWGYGRMNAAAAVGGTSEGKRPSITLQIAPAAPVVGDAITVTPVASSDDGDAMAIEARWDDGYDGSWETPYAPLAAHTLPAGAGPGVLHVKVRARNASGRIAEAVARIEVTNPRAAGSNAGCGCNQASEHAMLSGPTQMGTSGGFAALAWSFIARRRRRTERLNCPTMGQQAGVTSW